MFKKNTRKKASRLDTLIGYQTHIRGNITFTGGLRIDGRVEGNITVTDESDSVFTLSEQGFVEGEIRAPHLLLNGTITGNVYASKYIELAPKAKITGNVYYHLLEMAIGAEVNGQLIHINEEKNAILDLEHENNDDDPALRLPSE